MASIYEQTRNNKKHYYLVEWQNGKTIKTYLGNKPPLAKSRGWTNLSPQMVAWLKDRAQLKTRIVKIEPCEKGKYKTIVVDPPWPMEKVNMIARTEENIFDYQVMTLAQIANDRNRLPIRRLMNKSGCLVFLWTTQKFLPEAYNIMKAWGLKYLFTMVWAKGRGRQLAGLPQFNCEFVLAGRMGNLNFVDTKAFKTLFDGEARNHSQKPKEFYQLLKRITPEPRIDMFSREKHRGFDQYGNETDKYN